MPDSAYREFNFGLGEVIDAVRDQVRRFAQERIAPRASEIDRSNLFPRDLWREAGELGLLGMTVSEDHGGAGLGYLAHTIAMEEISRASAAVGLSYGAHSNLCVNQLALNATEEQKRRDLRLLILLVGCGIASVVWWRVSGDLRPYVLVQFGPVLLLLLSLRGLKNGKCLWAVLGLYVLAKLAEHFDQAIYSALPLSGHTCKHLLAAFSAYWILRRRMNSNNGEPAMGATSAHAINTCAPAQVELG